MWAIQIPEHAYVGISPACSSMEEARQQAIDSAIGQILQSMGADYRLSHESVLSGDLRNSRHELREELRYTARWLLQSVQENIRQQVFRNTARGYVCFVLVRMHPHELARLKRLTIGAKVTARVVAMGAGHLTIEALEANNVGVTLTECRVSMTTMNTHARLITLFFWKVPESKSTVLEGALPRRAFLKNGSGRMVIRVPGDENGLRDVLMGSVRSLEITLTGYDEIGRPVAVPVRLP
ncbi:MAG: hypothetical protein AB2L22_13010 [Syntrophales bacterium]